MVVNVDVTVGVMYVQTLNYNPDFDLYTAFPQTSWSTYVPTTCVLGIFKTSDI